MRIHAQSRLVLTCAVLLAAASTRAQAQAPRVVLPDASPHATVSQRVGLTDLSVDYHRPAVAGRKVWGGLVPYGEPWRAGANENTVLSVSTPFTVGGKQLPAGSYGVHVIPTEKGWTFALSTVSTAWGSFTYDPKEDAVRVAVTPAPAEMEERLEYRFEHPTDSSVDLVLHWEKLQAAVPIKIDTTAVTVASLKGQLRGLAQYQWQSWNQAAQWCLKAGCGDDQALAWVDRSIGVQPTFANLTTKAGVLERRKDTAGAAKLRKNALALANEADVNAAAYQLLGDKKPTEALALFRKNVADHPDSWNVHDSLGEALAATGDRKAAVESYTRARALVKDPAQQRRIDGILTDLRR